MLENNNWGLFDRSTSSTWFMAAAVMRLKKLASVAQLDER